MVHCVPLRETSRSEGKQNWLYPLGLVIKCIISYKWRTREDRRDIVLLEVFLLVNSRTSGNNLSSHSLRIRTQSKLGAAHVRGNTHQHLERPEVEAFSIFSTQASLQEWDKSTSKTSCMRMNRNPPASPKYIQTRWNVWDAGISNEHMIKAETEKLKASSNSLQW